ncbi:unnamed protein product [Gordionus sp. m RMFG-2023]
MAVHPSGRFYAYGATDPLSVIIKEYPNQINSLTKLKMVKFTFDLKSCNLIKTPPNHQNIGNEIYSKKRDYSNKIEPTLCQTNLISSENIDESNSTIINNQKLQNSNNIANNHPLTRILEKAIIYSLAWSPTGKLLACGTSHGTIKILKFDTDSMTINKKLLTNINIRGKLDQNVSVPSKKSKNEIVKDCLFLQDNFNQSCLLLSVGGDSAHNVRVTDIQTSTPIQVLSGHTACINCIFSPGGCTFVTGSDDKTVRFWDLRVPDCLHAVTGATNSITKGNAIHCACVDDHEKVLIAGHEDGTCLLYDIRGRKRLEMLRLHYDRVSSMELSANQKCLLTSSHDTTIRLTNIKGDLTKLNLVSRKSPTCNASFSKSSENFQNEVSKIIGKHDDKVLGTKLIPSFDSNINDSSSPDNIKYGINRFASYGKDKMIMFWED